MGFGEFARGAFFVKGFLPLFEGFLVKVGLFQTVVEVFFELVRQRRTTSAPLSWASNTLLTGDTHVYRDIRIIAFKK